MTWSVTKLGDLIKIKHGFAFKSKGFSDDGEYVLLTPGNFHEQGGLKLKGDKEKYYVGDIPEDYVLRAGDVVVVMTDLVNSAPILGGSAIIPEGNRFLHNQRLGLVEIKDVQRTDKEFLYYLLNTKQYRGQVRGSASGATVRHTAPERIYRCKVEIPTEFKTQRRIAAILSAYDYLIENNRRRIQLLEQSARMLYKEWFVHLRFPGHEHVKIRKGVPEGWERKRVEETVEFLARGITPLYDDEAIGLVINQKCIRNGLLNLDLARHQSKEIPKEKLVRQGDVLINSTGEGTLGRIAQVFFEIESCTVDSHVTIARPSEETIGRFYFGMSLGQTEPYLSTMGRGATNQTELSRSTIGELRIIVPPKEIAREFEELAYNVFHQIDVLMNQNRKLQQAREILLPRLMNGEINIQSFRQRNQ